MAQDQFKRNFYVFLFLVLSAAWSVVCCAPKQMTLDEAVQTTMSLRGKSFVPPPRSIDDILNIIARESGKDELISNQWDRLLKKELPTNATKSELIEYYYKGAEAAHRLGYFEQARSDVQKAYDLTSPERFDARIIGLWAGCELNLQNYDMAITLYTIVKERRMGFGPYPQLAYIYALTGQFEKADSLRNEAMPFFGSRKLSPFDEYNKARLEYIVLNMKAKYAEAEPIMRKAVVAAYAIRPPRPDLVQVERIRLIRNLIEQSHLVEAELEARNTLDESFKFLGSESVHIMAAKTILAEVLLAQGRVADAEKVNQAAVQAYEKSDIPPTYGWWSRSIETMGKILVAKGDYSGAMKEYGFFGGMRETNRNIYDAFYSNDKNVMLALIMTGRFVEAMELIESAYQRAEGLLGKGHAQSAELQALRGMVKHSLDNRESAYWDFSDSIPIMAASKTYSENRLSSHRFMLILESYISLLSKLRGSLIEQKYSFSASTKAFEISTLLSDSSVQNAVLGSTARMTIKDPRLKELARTEQNVQQQINAYQNLMQSLLSKPVGNLDRQAISNLKEMVDKLSKAREIIIGEIERRFPDYANLVNYRHPSLDDVQERLRREEVIISICSAETHTYIFSVPPTGSPEMTVVQVTKKDLEKQVGELKKSLTTGSEQLGMLPSYNFEKAYELYALLLKPTEETWKNSKHMILSVSGPLGQIPFSIITTGPFLLEHEKGVLFSNYREAPWLIKRISLNLVPSVSSFVALRVRPKSVEPKGAFAGFGDPVFNETQMAQALIQKKIHSARKTDENTKLDIRGIRLTKDGTLDNKKLLSCKVQTLERLPDTADELLSIAEALDANPVRDVYLGKRASETQVKRMDLSDRRVVAFASHALVPFDLDGLDQPAIALSAPDVTGEEDDGLLTMAEILDLRLNADWVVLSACNTGAADGAGAEAVSGLGRAFFYAGTKAVLVSMWPVETSSAKNLTTSLFRHLQDNPRLTRAQAHQMAMLELINGPGLLDQDGRIIASYAHPFFWAPFIIVGDNAMTERN